MSTHKIECPHCAQHIACDESYSGVKLPCPGCGKEMVIPPLNPAGADSATPVVALIPSAPATPRVVVRQANAPPAPAMAPTPTPPTAPAAMRVSAAASVHPLTPQPRAPLPARARKEEPAPSRVKTLLVVALAVVIGLPSVYFGFQWLTNAQKKFNEAQAKDDDPGLIGGQVSHIIELNQVLDATDPDKGGRLSSAPSAADGAGGRTRKARSAGINAGGAPFADDLDNLPIKPMAWSLGVVPAEIPPSRVGGTISKSNFVADSAWLVTGSLQPVLMFSQGESSAASDLGLLVYLRLKPGETLDNRTWTISQEQKSDVPQVMKRWRVSGVAQLQQRSFGGGYTMRLELGKIAGGVMPGKIYVALPDPEQSVVSGHFQALIRIPTPAQGKGPSARPGGDYGTE